MKQLLQKFHKIRFLMLLALFASTTKVTWADDITDVLNQAFTGITGTAYANFSDKTSQSSAVYAGQCAGGNESIQLRSNNSNSGVITTTSGGKAVSVTVKWNSNTTNGRTLNVYGKNEAYSAPTDLYDSSKQGTLLGTIVYGTSTTLSISGDYEYIGFRSNSGAMYLTSVEIVWQVGSTEVTAPTLPASTTFVGSMEVAITAGDGLEIHYTTDGTDPTTASSTYTDALTITETTTVKAIAVDVTGASSGVASATYTKLASYATIAELMALEDNAPFAFTGEALIVAKPTANYVYISDQTGSSLIYDASGEKTAAAEVGKTIAANWAGKVKIYNNLFELVPDAAIVVKDGDAVAVSYPTVTAADMTAENVNKVVTLKGITSYIVNENNMTIYVGDAEVVGYNKFGVEIAAAEDGKTYEIVGVISRFKDNIQFQPIEIRATDPYSAAMAAIEDGGNYRIFTEVNDVKYYVTEAGLLTDGVADGGIFAFNKVSGGALYDVGIQISTATKRFTNPPLANDVANMTAGVFATSTNNRVDWETQVLFMNDYNMFAIRSCNTQPATSSWGDAGRTFWTWAVEDAVVPQYTYDQVYVWQIEGPLTTINVSYQLYEADGETTVGSAVTKKQEANSEISIPADFKAQETIYDYTTEGTIGTENCTIKVIRTFKAGVVHSLDELSNDKAYLIRCDRGALLTKDDHLASTAHSSLTNAEPAEFAVIRYEDNYYLYSVADKKFVTFDPTLSPDGARGPLAGLLAHGVEDAIVMQPQSNPYFLTYFTVGGSNYGLNTNGSNPYGYVINSWMTADPGNLYYMIESSDFDPTEALAALDAYFHPSYNVTYVIKDAAGAELLTTDPQPARENDHITELPTAFQRPFYTYSAIDQTISQQKTTIEVTATWAGPFELSTNIANAKWYNMTIRSDNWVAMDESEPYYPTADKDLSAHESLWAFGGDAYNGIYVFNKAAGEGFTLTKDGDNAVMREGLYAWTIGSNDDGFTLKEPGTDYNCINQYGGSSGPLQFWNSGNSPTDNGSTFRVSDPMMILRKALEEAVATARESLERIGTDCTTAALGSLQEAIAKGEQEYDSNEKYEETIALVKNATSQAEEMSYYYLKCLRTREDIDEIRQVEGLEETVEGTFDALEAAETAANDDVIKAIMTVGEANEIIDNLRSALLTFLANIKPAQDHPVDISTLLENPDFEEGGEPMMGVLPGWTCTFIKNQTATNIGYMPNASNSNGVTSAVDNAYVNGDIRISHFMEAWQENTSPYMIGDGELYQRLSGLPIGKYRLVTDAIAVNQWYDSYNPVTGTYIYISSGQLETTTEIATGNGIPEHFEVDFINDHAESLDFGLKTINTTANWIAADNFRIYYVAALSESPGVAALKEALAGYDNVTFDACDATILETFNQEHLHATEMTQTDIYSVAHSSECIAEITTLKNAYDAVLTSVETYAGYQQEVEKVNNRIAQLKDMESPLANALVAYGTGLQKQIDEGRAVPDDFQNVNASMANLVDYWNKHFAQEDIIILKNVLTQLGEQPAWSERWNLEADELILDGITNTEGRVTAVRLSSRGLTGSVPPALMTLQKVTVINLSGNSFDTIEGDIPSTISVNLNNQQLEAVVNYKRTDDAATLLAQLPSILCYDSSAGGQTSHFAFAVSGNGWGFNLNENNGNLRFTTNSQCIYKEENGAVLQCTNSYGIAKGSTFGLKLTFDEGDANFNGEVNIGDLQMMINYIFDDLASGIAFNFTAADLFKDNRINVQDVVKEVDVLFAQTDDEAPVKAMYGQQNQKQEDIHASLRFEEGRLLLESDIPVTALDITVASDQAVSWQALQTMGFTVSIRNVSGGIRIIAYSMSGVEVPVGETAIATTTGSGTVLKATLSDKTSNTIGVYLNSAIPTSINDIDEASLEGASVYDLGGRKVADKSAALRHLPKGIYVINGKKVIK